MPEFNIQKYNLKLNATVAPSELDVELYCYRTNRSVEQGGLGAAGHFRRIADMLYGPKSQFPFEWNPWAERMNEVIHQHPVTGKLRPDCAFSGCANSGKSHFAGLYGIINWLSDPINTYVFLTSTGIGESKHRVWKSVNRLFTAVPKLPGVLVDSQAKICTIKSDGRHDDSSGLFVVAGAPSKAREAVGKLIGRKNNRVFLIADELPELSHAILEARGNLIGNRFFQFVAMGNFKSRYDPFGEFVEPKDGWESISIESDEWEAVGEAYVVRFDGTKSPNVLAGKDIYPHLYGIKQLKVHQRDYGPESPTFWRMCRSYEPPVGLDDCIYSESELLSGNAYAEPIWVGDVERIAGIDPSYTNGGDRFVLFLAKLGRTTDGKMTLYFHRFHLLYEDVRKSASRPRGFQMADQCKKLCEDFGITRIADIGMDTTATGGIQADIFEEVWGQHGLHRVDFSSSATEMSVHAGDNKTAKEQYCNRVSELWYVGREFIKSGQIKGIKPEQAREMKARIYDTVKGGDGLRVKVESKKDMKERLLFSPDIAEAGFIALDTARAVHGFVVSGQSRKTVRSHWRTRALALDAMNAVAA